MNTDVTEAPTEVVTDPGLPGFKLTEDQQSAMDKLMEFLLNPDAQVFVLSGYAGCGKSTLVKYFLDHLPKLMTAMRLVRPNFREPKVDLTATTHKAAENLAHITGMSVQTIHSYLGLRVSTDWRTRETGLAPVKSFELPSHRLVLIDEASYIDPQLLEFVFTRTAKCKIVFLGDPAQLTPVKHNDTPVFKAGFEGAALTTVMRQAAGNPIIDLATKFRHTVNTGKWFSFNPDGKHVVYVQDPDEWQQLILAELGRADWKFRESKVLAWTNKAVINYNHFIRDRAKGSPTFQAGDYAICNKYCTPSKGKNIANDATVLVSEIEPESEHLGVNGHWYLLNDSIRAFMPINRDVWKAAMKQAKAEERFSDLNEMDSNWIDLRAAFACTINKSQGSTFDKVFIDLDDVARCNSGEQIARMMYVAVSRARHTVYLHGDLA